MQQNFYFSWLKPGTYITNSTAQLQGGGYHEQNLHGYDFNNFYNLTIKKYMYSAQS